MAEAEPGSREERLRMLLAAVDAALDGIALVDATLKFEYVNQAFCRLVEYEAPQELIGLTATQLIAEDDLQLLAGGAPSSTGDEAPEALEIRVRTRSGRIVPVETTVSPLRDASAKLRGFIAFVRDITARKRAQAEILYKTALLETQREATIDGILVVDGTGKMISFNRRFVEIWDIPEDVIASRSDERALQSVTSNLADPQAFLDRVRYLYEHPEEESRDEIPLRDGRTLDRYSAPVRGADGTYYGRVWYFRDITESKEAEKALQARNRELESFVYMASHDLRIPLTTIEGFARLLSEDYGDGLDAEGRDYLWRVLDSAVSMKALLADLLEFSHVERTKEPAEDVAVGEVVSDVLQQLGGAISESGAQITVPPDLPVIRVSRHRLSQVFSNLLSNAVKFSKEGVASRVTVGWERLAHGYRFTVADNGIGIEDESREEVFDLFTRLKRKNVPGTGVGLAIVKRIVEDYGGRVGVDSKLDEGSTFWFTIPDPR